MLRGSLSDVSVYDLVLIPASSRKTGELLIATIDDDARLYYVNGGLVHLEKGELVGRAVLEEIAEWRDGEFEFRANVLTAESSFDGDLRAEVREVEKKIGQAVSAAPQEDAQPPVSPLLEQITRYVERSGVRFVLIVDAKGAPVEQAGEVDDVDLGELGNAVMTTFAATSAISTALACDGCGEVLVDFGGLRTICVALGDGVLIVVTDGQSQLGVVRHKTKQLVESINRILDGPLRAPILVPNSHRNGSD